MESDDWRLNQRNGKIREMAQKGRDKSEDDKKK